MTGAVCSSTLAWSPQCIKGSIPRVESLVPLIHHDMSDLRSISLIRDVQNPLLDYFMIPILEFTNEMVCKFQFLIIYKMYLLAWHQNVPCVLFEFKNTYCLFGMASLTSTEMRVYSLNSVMLTMVYLREFSPSLVIRCAESLNLANLWSKKILEEKHERWIH